MALSEQRVVKSVEINPSTQTVNVLWVDQILRDGEIITEQNHRKSFSQDTKNDFVSEVDGAELYLSALNWD